MSSLTRSLPGLAHFEYDRVFCEVCGVPRESVCCALGCHSQQILIKSRERGIPAPRR